MKTGYYRPIESCQMKRRGKGVFKHTWNAKFQGPVVQNSVDFGIVLTKTVNNLTTNKLVKLMRLWTTGPRSSWVYHLLEVFGQTDLSNSVDQDQTLLNMLVNQLFQILGPIWDKVDSKGPDSNQYLPQKNFFFCLAQHVPIQMSRPTCVFTVFPRNRSEMI